jgi:cell wall-associated NlpC family hydrolase
MSWEDRRRFEPRGAALLGCVPIVRRSSAFRGRTTTLGAGRHLALVLVVVSLFAPMAVRVGVAAADPVSDKRAQATRLAAQLSALSQRSSALAESYDRARIHQADVDNRLAATKAKLALTTGALGAAQQRVKAAAIQAYMQGGAAQQLSLLIPAAANEIGLRGTYVKSVTASTNDAVDALHATKTELGILQGQLTAAQADAARSVTQVASAQKAAAAADAQISAAYASAQAQLGQALADARQAELVANQHRVQTAQARRIGPTTVNLLPLPPPGAGASSAIAWAKAELGKPYVYGGGGPDSFDCSGLTAWAWGHAGHSLPHSSEQQYYNTTHLSVDQLQPGDLVFFGMPPHHVGIYVGGGQMINALHSGTNVEYDSIYMEGDLIGGGRVN